MITIFPLPLFIQVRLACLYRPIGGGNQDKTWPDAWRTCLHGYASSGSSDV